MKISKNVIGKKLILGIAGRLDTITAPELEYEVRNSLDGITELSFDMNQLEYISSAGLRVLLAAQKIMNQQGSMEISGCSEDIMEIFDVTGFTEILTIK
jgi:anti-sigma B factor antagonist